MKEYGLWSAEKIRVSKNISCSEVAFRMALAKADSRFSIEILNCISDAYKLAFLRESSLIISVWVSLSLGNARSWVALTYFARAKSKIVGSVLS